jgi:hypothetical protein
MKLGLVEARDFIQRLARKKLVGDALRVSQDVDLVHDQDVKYPGIFENSLILRSLLDGLLVGGIAFVDSNIGTDGGSLVVSHGDDDLGTSVNGSFDSSNEIRLSEPVRLRVVSPSMTSASHADWSRGTISRRLMRGILTFIGQKNEHGQDIRINGYLQVTNCVSGRW